MKKTLVFVLACGLKPYPSLTSASLETWAKNPADGVDVAFYCGIPCAPQHRKVVGFPVNEGVFTMGKKNLLAYKWALENGDWDYMARVNASCYVRTANLSNYVQSLPESNVFEGVNAPKGDGTFYLWGGAQYIISRDVVRAIVENGDRWDHKEMEDVAMSRLVKELGIPWRSGRACSVNKLENHWLCITYGDNVKGSFEFFDLCEMAKADDQNFIRVKQDLNREKDIEIMKQLHGCGL